MANAKLEEKRNDQYLTNFIKTESEGESVADFIAPAFPVNYPSDKYLIFGKQNLRYYDDKIVGRAPSKEVSPEADSGTYSCEEYESAFYVLDRAIRNTNGVAGIRLREQKAAFARTVHHRAREKRIWDIAGSTSIVTQYSALANAWDTPASATPITNILNGISTIYSSTGLVANRIVLSLSAALKAIQSAEYKDYFKYTETGIKESLFNLVAGLRNLGLEPRISGMRSLSTYEIGTSDPTVELISGVGKVLIFYGQDSPNTESNCFMFSPYTVKDMVKTWRDTQTERGEHGTIYTEIDELLVNAYAAYLYTGAIA
jgi:hypothetical protein